MGAAALPKILSQLFGCSNRGDGQWQACCPVHKSGKEDDPSFGVSLKPDGQILLHCFAGCPKDEILARLGVTLADLAPDEDSRPRLHDPERPKPKKDFAFLCDDRAKKFAESTVARPHLAQALALPESVFNQFPGIGCFNDHPQGGSGWSFPERNAHGSIIGVGLRFRDGTKRAEKESERGLSIPNGWQSRAGALYLPEGPSDVLALTAASLAAIGRPSNVGGVELLAELINNHVPPDRVIVWLGEHDTPDKRTGRRAGVENSRKAAKKLAGLVKNPVHFALPPGKNDKDIRAWLVKLVGEGCEWPEAGERLVALLNLGEPLTTVAPPVSSDTSRLERVTVYYNPGDDEMRVGDEVVKILASDSDLFVRSRQISRVIWESAHESDTGVIFPDEPVIEPVDIDTMRAHATRAISFTKRKRSGDGPTNPPDSVLKAVLKRGRWAGFRKIRATVAHPIVRRDGTIVTAEGYDPETHVYLTPVGLPPILPPVINRAAAVAALAEIEDVISDFPFLKPCHRAAWFTGLLTPLARYAFKGPVPLFLIDSNTPGTGKGLLANVAGVILTGQELPTSPYSHEDEEMRKKITTIIKQGSPQALFDNISGSFGSSVMDIVLTSTRWEDRLLGSNTSVTLPILTSFWATGNNVQIAGDGLRRVAHARIESKLERPEERTGFRYEKLLQHVLTHRPRLLGAALTILAAYIRTGCPKVELLTWGSYEGWSEIVRSAVVWLDVGDPAEGKQELRQASDPEEAAMATLFTEWKLLDPTGKGITTNQITARVFPPKQETPAELADLADAITTMCPKQTGQQLAARFRKWHHRATAGWRLIKLAKHANTYRWGVERAPHGSLIAGEDGEDKGVFPLEDTEKIKTKELTKNSYVSEETGLHPHHPHPPGEYPPFSDYDTE